MLANNLIAEGVETHGVRTFSAKEMAFNILGLMHPLLFDVAQVEPVWADLNGGMDKLPDLAEITLKVRQELNEVANVCSKISLDNAIDYKVVHGIEAEAIHHPVKISPRANFTLPIPELRPNFDDEATMTLLRGMLDLNKSRRCHRPSSPPGCVSTHLDSFPKALPTRHNFTLSKGRNIESGQKNTVHEGQPFLLRSLAPQGALDIKFCLSW